MCSDLNRHIVFLKKLNILRWENAKKAFIKMNTNVEVKDAASVILIRNRKTNPSVLMGQRGKNAALCPINLYSQVEQWKKLTFK